MRNFEIEIGMMQFVGIEELRQKDSVPLLKINGQRMEYPVFNNLKRNLEVSTVRFNFPWLWIPGWHWIFSPMSDIAHKVAKLIIALGHKQVDVLGVSWGGALASELAVLYPGLVRRLVLVSTTARPYRMFQVPVFKAYIEQDYGGKSRKDARLQADVKSQAGRSPFLTDVYRGIALLRWNGEARLPLIKQPTLIVSGDDDTIAPLEESVFMNERIANSTLAVIRDGHLAIYSSAKIVAQHVNQFLI